MMTTREVAERLHALHACPGAIDRVRAAADAETAWRDAPPTDLWWLVGRISHPAVPALVDRCIVRAARAAAWGLAAAGALTAAGERSMQRADIAELAPLASVLARLEEVS